ncbi:MAG: acetyl-CoA carboxylase biotin carboxyl carrier protein subunit [Bacteroidota bacterium]
MSEYVITYNQKKHSVKIMNSTKVEINGKVINVELTEINKHSMLIKLDNIPFEAAYNSHSNGNYEFLIEGSYFNINIRTKLQDSANEIISQKESTKKLHECRAPMPGLINKVLRNVGDTINIGDPIIILEAMKMENELRSNYSGTIKEILVKSGEAVEKDAIIMTIE